MMGSISRRGGKYFSNLSVMYKCNKINPCSMTSGIDYILKTEKISLVRDPTPKRNLIEEQWIPPRRILWVRRDDKEGYKRTVKH